MIWSDEGNCELRMVIWGKRKGRYDRGWGLMDGGGAVGMRWDELR